jgi:hypothetical protein
MCLKHAAALCLMSGLLVAHDAQARETLQTGGHLKLFSVTSLPQSDDPLADEASGQAVTDLRVKLLWRPHRTLRFEFHPQLTLSHQGSLPGGLQTGVQETLPEGLPLSYDILEDPGVQSRVRADRATVRWDQGPVRLTVGRQAVTFGKGRIFTPLDLVSAFRPTTLDTSYKPGVDAVRADLFEGVSGQVSLVAAYLGDWAFDEMALVLHGKGSVSDWELEGSVGSLYGDIVLGTSLFYNAGALGYYADVNVTLPEDDSFIRSLLGVQLKPSESTLLNVEVYLQSLGEADPGNYMSQYASPRFGRGELWLAGQVYGAVAGQLEITPLLTLGGAIVYNPLDSSVLAMPTLLWSVAENATASAGALIGVGRGASLDGSLGALDLRSEFGHLPSVLFISASLYY